MKYQIYLNKEISDIINALAKAEGKKTNTFIKDFVEHSFEAVKTAMDDDQIKVIVEYGKRK